MHRSPLARNARFKKKDCDHVGYDHVLDSQNKDSSEQDVTLAGARID